MAMESNLQQLQRHLDTKKKSDWPTSLDIGFLTETERDMIIDVLRRDEKLRTYERKRIIQLKSELREVRRKGAKKPDVHYSSHLCERCNATTGHIINKAHTCPICKHKTCESCRVNSKDFWICVVCFKESKIKAKSGEWFYDTMRAELKPLADGSTLLKRAVLDTAPPKTAVRRDRHIAAPEIKYTPASSSSSSSRRSSFNKSPDMTSMGSMESLPSSTESHSRSMYSRSGPAETGSIESLRSLRYLGRDYFSDSDQSGISSRRSSSFRSGQTIPSPAVSRNVSTMPRVKQSLDSPWSRDSVSTGDRSSSSRSQRDVTIPDTPSQRENASAQNKSNSLKKKLHVAGRKLQVHQALSRSVPSLAVQQSPSSHASVAKSAPDYDDLSLPGNKSMSLSTSNLSDHDQMERLSTGVGEIKFSLEYDYRENNLLVFIAECRNLTYADINRKSCDPYVKCYLLPDRSIKRKTNSRKNTSVPKFNQTLKFSVDISELGNRVLEMSVWNSATFSRNSFLGHLQIGLDAWKWQPNPTPHWYPLKQKEIVRSDSLRSDVYKGDVVFSLSYKSPEKCLSKYGELHVLIKQAKNLPATMPGAAAVDAYARISILPEKDVQEKTLVVTGSANPVWNARFRLPFIHHPVEGSGLEITLWRKPRGSATSRRSRRLLLGGVRLAQGKYKDHSSMATVAEERLIWEKVCNSAGVWVDASLSLRVF